MFHRQNLAGFPRKSRQILCPNVGPHKFWQDFSGVIYPKFGRILVLSKIWQDFGLARGHKIWQDFAQPFGPQIWQDFGPAQDYILAC